MQQISDRREVTSFQIEMSYSRITSLEYKQPIYFGKRIFFIQNGTEAEHNEMESRTKWQDIKLTYKMNNKMFQNFEEKYFAYKIITFFFLLCVSKSLI